MSLPRVAVLAAPLVLAGAGLAREAPPSKPAPPQAGVNAGRASAARSAPARSGPPLREPAGAASPARERQRNCAAEWRGLSSAEKTAQGPKWPQFYSRCIKRQKGSGT